MAISDKRFIVLHHSATKDSGTVSWDAIRRYHVETNGWRAIGYHFGVELVGTTYEILVGRMLHDDAAAVKEQRMNTRGVHVCVVGDFDDAPVPKAQWTKAVELAAALCVQLNIRAVNIMRHTDYAPYKSCPGKLFDIDLFRLDVEKVLMKTA